MPAELDDLVAPPAAPDFRERLWERAAERERVVARRWRAAAIGATAVAVGTASFRDPAAGDRVRSELADELSRRGLEGLPGTSVASTSS